MNLFILPYCSYYYVTTHMHLQRELYNEIHLKRKKVICKLICDTLKRGYENVLLLLLCPLKWLQWMLLVIQPPPQPFYLIYLTPETDFCFKSGKQLNFQDVELACVGRFLEKSATQHQMQVIKSISVNGYVLFLLIFLYTNTLAKMYPN